MSLRSHSIVLGLLDPIKDILGENDENKNLRY